VRRRNRKGRFTCASNELKDPQSIRNSHDVDSHCRENASLVQRLEDWRGPVVWLPSSPSHERFSSFAGGAPSLPWLALAFAFPSRNPGRARSDQVVLLLLGCAESSTNGFLQYRCYLSDAGRLQGTACSAVRAARAYRLCIHQCYHNTCILLWATHASTIRTWVPPESHASPHPDRRLHAAVPPVFHVALLAHDTADVLPAQWTRTSGTTRVLI
jgi:hypothetical protein